MPGMSGLELLPKAKAARPDVPIIMSAFGYKADVSFAGSRFNTDPGCSEPDPISEDGGFALAFVFKNQGREFSGALPGRLVQSLF